ncbi:MAG: hypothetical protein RR022_02440 [Angelakisella sp.]
MEWKTVAFERLQNLLFPPRCVFCDEVVLPGEGCCTRCDAAERLTGTQAVRQLSEGTLYSCFRYGDAGRRSLAALKFHGQHAPVAYYAQQMSALLTQHLGEMPFEVVTYMPMPPERERGRGYNQAKLLAQALGALRGLPVDDCGLQKSDVLAQHDLNRSMRLKRPDAGLQLAAAAAVQGRVLLVDDLATTGSSIAAGMRLLRRAGASQVVGITIFSGI